MTKYRDQLGDEYDQEIGSVVGCGLDRLGREVSSNEINCAISFYRTNKSKIDEFPIGARRQAVEEFVANGMEVPMYIKI